ncbi:MULTISPECIES: D-alanyl-D-alanine carboxypeptidase/D-alanyl-D-alanine endopeptidase [unclassified Streptomyces]|uniref:D-alanyl-D-alanine carboxypeptidase/D-alanyl-D-alanine endopeptidase n=1 Tax=unclassified Streptomyces TaxID=2593676 RepID=UPI0022B68A24|nr:MULTISPECIES: D-alanyl-D-alanine carboxypeptidase/D-alanyl-D-alanine-endopeptidase [unclassified Streptomyces]MCZ7415095.1 D-alanyl-D-alanine carboxypeptidase/D-alanyl-D-alanine-endopeptidase [Streptomyces sp. WMMC897]MCZ7432038.1 D-alanyl-D-alanine carboxypeptidase/D-alanyl-D-alanine-endopeptidase [Streptomyces sp. WMMC1477]
MRDAAGDGSTNTFRDTVRRAGARWSGHVRQRWRTLPPQRRTLGLTAGSAAVGLAVSLGAVAAAGPWDHGQRTAERTRAAALESDSGGSHTDDARPGSAAGPEPGEAPEPAPSAPPVLRPADASGEAPTRGGLAQALRAGLKDEALGRTVGVAVVDVATGRVLYESGGDKALVPASTIKLATATAALTALGPEHRLETRTVWDPGSRRVLLVGGGDPTLTEDRLAALAQGTAEALREQGLHPKALGYDVSRFSGDLRHPIGVNPNLAPLSPLMLNAARTDGSRRGPAPREADPAAAVADRFAELLDEHGVSAGRTERARAPKDARRLAATRSAPLAGLVERMLTDSDNDLAEALARHTALATGEPADFDGARAAAQEVLRGLGLPVGHARFADGSGLSRDSRVSATLLASLLATAAHADHPELRPVLTGMPVAGFTGTLGGRYGTEATEDAAGVVRAKTGTLTGVNALAGTVVDADGRLLAFAFLTNGTESRGAAHAALDRLATALAGCGCR